MSRASRRTLVSHKLRPFNTGDATLDKHLDEQLRDHTAQVFSKLAYLDKYTPDNEIIAAEILAGVTPASFRYPPGHVFRYMSDSLIADVRARTLTLDCRTAIQSAISVAQQSAGVEVYIPAGAYLVNRVAGGDSQYNGIVVPYTNVFGYAGAGISIRGEGQSSVLYAGDNSMTVIRWSDSNGRLDNLALEVNGKTGASALSLIGSNTASATLAEHIDWNTFSRLSINGFAEGIELESPAAGGCYYNRFRDFRLYNNTRHIRLRDNATNRGPNRNTFVAGSILGGNVGIYIDGADTTQLIAVHFEAVATGSSPLANPTAIYINSVGTLSGADTENTNIIGCMTEGCTRDLDCSNRRTSIIGGTIGNVASVVTTAYPDIWLGGDHAQVLRELFLGDSGATDALYLDNRFSAYGGPRIGTSANAAGAFPFENDGSILIQAREQAASGIQLATGASSNLGLDILGDGSIVARTDSRYVKRIATVAYSASITIDAKLGNEFLIPATTGVAVAMNAPTNGTSGQEILIRVKNTSGGALGVWTFNGVFKMPSATPTMPANGFNRVYVFTYDGTNYVLNYLSAADVPN